MKASMKNLGLGILSITSLWLAPVIAEDNAVAPSAQGKEQLQQDKKALKADLEKMKSDVKQLKKDKHQLRHDRRELRREHRKSK
ncbi:MAG: hypothetical protein J0L93_10950 [Deltaproteobacteria bacterium]|nr:hypothetical protein [Deltaproteobacteria bacterium]